MTTAFFFWHLDCITHFWSCSGAGVIRGLPGADKLLELTGKDMINAVAVGLKEVN